MDTDVDYRQQQELEEREQFENMPVIPGFNQVDRRVDDESEDTPIQRR